MENIQDYAISRAERTGYGYEDNRRPVCDCDECHCQLYEGDTVLQIHGFNFCSDCVEEGTTDL